MKFIVANWKQNKTEQDAVHWLHQLEEPVAALSSDVRVVVAAPYSLLPVMRETIDVIEMPIGLAAQDISAYEDGAYTGEVGVEQLKYLIDSVIVGHSERRMYFGDNNETVAKKVQHATAEGLMTFVCVADQINEDGSVPREKQNVSDDWFEMHVQSIFTELDTAQSEKITLVYEPISAISTFGGKPLTQSECEEAHERIKALLKQDVPIMYGGSVNANNIDEYWNISNVSGVMPGNASLDPESFSALLAAIA